MTLLKELIDIPEYVQKGDFVLRLTEGVTNAERTLGEYVVTPELTRCFDDALAFIRSAVESNTSKATYLHGSFGSGKSHFMAVLHLILQGNAAARGIPELADVVTRHNAWTEHNDFLLVPYHMIGARNMEAGILGGYVDFVRKQHPEAPIPGVYLAEGMFEDAQRLRESVGEQAFFKQLNEAAGGDGGWGELDAGWDANRFEAAVAAPPDASGEGSDDRSLLIGALVKAFFSSYGLQAGHTEDYLPLDKGLSVISKHAQSLGYNGLILFLDELVLWLASHASDLKFVHQEGQKLAKLVEAQTADRPVPIISFVARQRDLTELIGESVPGADRLNFGDALKHWEGRFHKITLEDRNLPAIAEKRVLKCKSEAARKELDAAFEQTTKVRQAVLDTLMTSEGDREMFRKVYPFSPALVQTLIAVSSVLQRERTALKVMMQLLVDQREALEVGDIAPVGDLFDVIAHGDEAFSQDMAIHFDNAKRLYHHKLLPLLEKQHGRWEEIGKLPYDDPKRAAFRNDDRLVKTLLLSALVPQVEPLRGLTAERLAALNHGTIKTPIPGREGQEVLRRCKQWAASVGEIRVGDEASPTISVQLSGVDTEAIIEQARSIDNQGNRVRHVRAMLFEQLGIEDRNEFFLEHEFLWRNTRRSCQILFRNVRERDQLPDASLENESEDWKLVIGCPFDPGHGPRDQVARLDDFREDHEGGAKTLCWLPSYLSEDAERDLGTLVVLDHVLSGERFNQYATHLSRQDRMAAKSLLENQRSVLRQRVQNHLEAAYGLNAPSSPDSTRELELDQRFESLQRGLDPQPPAAANLSGAMHDLLGQALAWEFPAAPMFEAEIRPGVIKKVYEQVSEATRSPDGRVAVERPLRQLLRQIANPLHLGEMGHDATHFVLAQQWKQHFTKKAAESGQPMTVGWLRRWIDEPKAMGLPKEAQNLVILAFAEQTDRSFYLHGAPYEATLSNLSDDCELREQKLPPEAEWKTAIERAGSIFGVAVSRLLNASNVARLARDVQASAEAAREGCRSYAQRLRRRLEVMQIDPAGANRLKTAEATAKLVKQLANVSAEEVGATLAHAEVVTSEAAMGEIIAHGGSLAEKLEATSWEMFEALTQLDDERAPAAKEGLEQVREALRNDEHVVALGPALQQAQSRALRLLTESVSKPVAPPPPEPEAETARRVVDRGEKQDLSPDDVEQILARLRQSAGADRRVRLNVNWVVEENSEQ